MKKVCALLGVAAVLMLCASPASAVIINVARQGTASASSEAYGGAPARGIDGGLGPSWTLDATTTHTGDSAFSWWQVDLGGAMPITQVDLYNRGDCCNPDRLGDFRVNVLDAPGGSVVYSEHYPGDVGVGNAASINLPAGVVGQVVQVQLVGENGGANDGLNNAGSGFLSVDPWRANAVVTFRNASPWPARIMGLHPGEPAFVPMLHGPTHWTSERGRMQAASSDPSAAWIAPDFESAMDLYRPEFASACLYVVQVRDADGTVREAGRVELTFIPGRWTELSLDAAGALLVRHGLMSSGLGLRPDVAWGESRRADDLPPAPARPMDGVSPGQRPEGATSWPPAILPPLPDG